MRRALLVDDDYLVRTYLKMLPSWQRAGFEIGADVRDGEEALKKLDEEKFDLVVTDIEMPLVDGVELIREIRKHYENLYIIVLSCHDDFIYVKEAMQKGANEYVLKNTLNEETLYTLLTAAAEKIEAKKDKPEGNIAKNESGNRINQKFLFFNRILAGSLKKEEVEKERRKLGVRGEYKNSAVILIRLENKEEEEDPLAEIRTEQQYLDFFNFFQREVRQMAPVPETEQEIVYLGNGIICCFIDLSKVYKSSIMQQKVTNMASVCYKVCKSKQSLFKIGVSQPCIGTQALHQAYQQARGMIKSGFYEPNDIIYYDSQKYVKKELPAKAKKVLEQLKISRFGIRKEQFSKLSAEAILAFKEERTEGRAVISWLKKLEQEALQQDKMRAEKIHSIYDIEKAVKEIAEKIFVGIDIDIPDNVNPAVQLAAQYTLQHFREPIGLNDAADAAKINSTYLSYLFRQEMGIGFSNYLLSLRIEYAKKLLKESSLKVWQVAEQSGFNDYHYFSKVFKKSTGVSPAQYRLK